MNKRAHRASAAGYTILELLIVLAIVGLMAAIAAPPFIRLIEQQQRVAASAETIRAISALPMTARGLRRDIVIKKAADTSQPLSPMMTLSALPEVREIERLPPGWTASPREDIWIRSDGVCYGGRVDVTDPEGLTVTYLLSPPLCLPVEELSAASP